MRLLGLSVERGGQGGEEQAVMREETQELEQQRGREGARERGALEARRGGGALLSPEMQMSLIRQA